MCESSFDLQFSLSDTSDDENAVNVKDKASNDRHRGMYIVYCVLIKSLESLLQIPTFSVMNIYV